MTRTTVAVTLLLSPDSYELGKYWVHIIIRGLHTATIRHCAGWISLLTVQGRYLYCLVCSGCHNKLTQTAWLKQQKLFLRVLQPGKLKIKVQVRSVSFSGLFSWLIGSRHLTLCSHGLSLVLAQDREGPGSRVPLPIRTLILLGQGAHVYEEPHCSQGFHIYILGRHKHSDHNGIIIPVLQTGPQKHAKDLREKS